MKKLISIVLCVVLAICLIVSANAVESSSLSIEAVDVSAASTELTIRVQLADPVTDGVFSFYYDAAQLTLLSVESPAPDAAEINGPAGTQGLSAGADLPAGQIKTAFVFDEIGIAGDTVLECRFQITGAARQFAFTADDGKLYRNDQSVSCPAVSKTVSLSDDVVGPGTPSRPSQPATPTPIRPGKPAAPDRSFDDVKPDDWFYREVTDLVDKGYINGVSDKLFAPSQNLSRGMLVTILFRIDGEKAVTAAGTFSDVTKGSWYENAVAWAAANGIVYGYADGRFGPDDMVTRQQMAAILWRYAQYKGLDVAAAGAALPSFPDRGQVASWAGEAVSWAYSRGIMTGKNGGMLDPNGNASRAEAAVMLYRFLKL